MLLYLLILQDEHGREPLDTMDGVPEEAFLSNRCIGIDLPVEAEEPFTSDIISNVGINDSRSL